MKPIARYGQNYQEAASGSKEFNTCILDPSLLALLMSDPDHGRDVVVTFTGHGWNGLSIYEIFPKSLKVEDLVDCAIKAADADMTKGWVLKVWV